jgi:hypothetical protein
MDIDLPGISGIEALKVLEFMNTLDGALEFAKQETVQSK